MNLRTLLFFSFLLSPISGFCQADTIFLHSGAALAVEVGEIHPLTVMYVPSGGKNQKSISKLAVQRIVYANGNKIENVSPFVSVQGVGDWEKVIFLDNESETAGLSYSGEIKAEGGGKFIDSAQANARAVIQLKKNAAARKCPYIYVNTSRIKEVGYVGRLIKKSAVTYKY